MGNNRLYMYSFTFPCQGDVTRGDNITHTTPTPIYRYISNILFKCLYIYVILGLRMPWKGILLFGPPGTGKTLLAKAVASLTSSVFINCSSSNILCKYRGDSEKTIRCLFDAAKLSAPSIIFIDEIDGLTGSKHSQNEHEATRRLRTEFFIQMDGLKSNTSIPSIKRTPQNFNGGNASGQPASNTVLVLATTNTPWDLDESLIRRLEKRIYIPLPDPDARVEIFQLYLKDMQHTLTIQDIRELIPLTEYYSSADIHHICKEAAMLPLRKVMLKHNNPYEVQQLYLNGTLELNEVLLLV